MFNIQTLSGHAFMHTCLTLRKLLWPTLNRLIRVPFDFSGWDSARCTVSHCFLDYLGSMFEICMRSKDVVTEFWKLFEMSVTDLHAYLKTACSVKVTSYLSCRSCLQISENTVMRRTQSQGWVRQFVARPYQRLVYIVLPLLVVPQRLEAWRKWTLFQCAYNCSPPPEVAQQGVRRQC